MVKNNIRYKFLTYTLSLSITLSTITFVFAQQQMVTVSGKITDKNYIAIPYAPIVFINKSDKTLSSKSITDDIGSYSLNLTPGTYIIEIEAPGFKKTSIKKIITITENIGNIQIENLKDLNSIDRNIQNIQGVVITATETKPYKVEVSKKIYDPSTDLISKGGTLQDILTNVPSVSVDTDGTVSMRGNTNIKFLINGKPSYLLGTDYGVSDLQSIPADQIEKIEIITTPSSKFEASGTSGILNIILKKNKKIGFNGNVIGTLGYMPKTALNTNLSWKKNNWTFFLNGGGGYIESKSIAKNELTYHNIHNPKLLSKQSIYKNSIPSYLYQNSNNKTYNNNYSLTGGFIYDISDKTSLNLSSMIRTFEIENREFLTTYNEFYNTIINTYKWNLINSTGNRISLGKSNNLGFQTDFGIDHKFNTSGQNLSLSLSIQRNQSNNSSNIDEILNSTLIGNDNTKRKSITRSVIGKIDYELSISENSKLESGYRLDSNKNEYDNTVNSISYDTNIYPIDPFIPRYNNSTNYQETFNAFYVQFKSKIGNISYQLGLRDELSSIKIDYKNLDGRDNINKIKNYNNLFPSIFLNYNIAKNDQILFNYSYRIDRPRIFFMIPFPNYNNNQNIFEGNIDLNPSYVNSFEVGYSIQRKKITINPTLYYNHGMNDYKILVYRPDERENIFYTKPINLGNNNRYGLDLNFTYNPFLWLKLMGSLDLFGYKTTGIATYNTTDINGKLKIGNMDFTGNGLSTRIRLNTTFKLDDTFNIQLQGNYRGAQKTKNQNRSEIYIVNFGASKSIWKGDGVITFNIQDIFNTRRIESLTFNNDFTRRYYMQWHPRQFSISLSYRFKQGERIDQPKKKKDINNNYSGGNEQDNPI